ncbi:hypothetical protein EIP91_011807 [Steccherinum ochraceum]|uniref:Uncharacterized protein n=1 Tax=Steccherinum ochraceum TaxID=92696 RepID=A0A4R0RLS9_9APHY|nr:hypothetical protein EIP91_011807 [Steccherinum ochraceum]
MSEGILAVTVSRTPSSTPLPSSNVASSGYGYAAPSGLVATPPSEHTTPHRSAMPSGHVMPRGYSDQLSVGSQDAAPSRAHASSSESAPSYVQDSMTAQHDMSSTIPRVLVAEGKEERERRRWAQAFLDVFKSGRGAQSSASFRWYKPGRGTHDLTSEMYTCLFHGDSPDLGIPSDGELRVMQIQLGGAIKKFRSSQECPWKIYSAGFLAEDQSEALRGTLDRRLVSDKEDMLPRHIGEVDGYLYEAYLVGKADIYLIVDAQTDWIMQHIYYDFRLQQFICCTPERNTSTRFA